MNRKKQEDKKPPYFAAVLQEAFFSVNLGEDLPAVKAKVSSGEGDKKVLHLCLNSLEEAIAVVERQSSLLAEPYFQQFESVRLLAQGRLYTVLNPAIVTHPARN